jgi:carbonic anhydrase
VELLFDQSIGHMFVTRVAGNVVAAETIARLGYGAAVLGTKANMVLRHAGCGAVKSTIQGKEVPGQISALYPHIQPAVDQAGYDLQAASKPMRKSKRLSCEKPLQSSRRRSRRESCTWSPVTTTLASVAATILD